MRNSDQVSRLGRLLTLLALCGLAGGVQLGCDTNDGPAEDAGEAIDDAGDDMEDAVDDIG